LNLDRAADNCRQPDELGERAGGRRTGLVWAKQQAMDLSQRSDQRRSVEWSLDPNVRVLLDAGTPLQVLLEALVEANFALGLAEAHELFV
jgi:hypothetical protein